MLKLETKPGINMKASVVLSQAEEILNSAIEFLLLDTLACPNGIFFFFNFFFYNY